MIAKYTLFMVGLMAMILASRLFQTAWEPYMAAALVITYIHWSKYDEPKDHS